MTSATTSVPVDWASGPLFTLRVAGLPLHVVDGLRCPATRQWAEEVHWTEAELARRGAELSDLLYELIRSNDDQQARRRLLQLRRQVYRNALPADPERALEWVREVRPDAAGPLGGWLHRRQRLEQLRAEGEATLAAEAAATREELFRLVTSPRLRRGIQVASTALDRQLVALEEGGAGRLPPKKLRRIERSVLSYLYRTACKTSPFSTLTGVVPGEFDEDAALELTIGDSWRGHAHLNVVVVNRIVALLAADPVRRADLPVTLTPGSHQDDHRVRYVRRWVTAGDDEATVSIDQVRDGLFFLRRSGILDRLTTLFHTGQTPRCRDVVQWLAQQTGAAPEQAERYLSTLLDLDLLQLPGLAVDVHSPDPLRGLQQALARVAVPWAEQLAAELGQPIALVDAYPEADLGRRRELMTELRESLHRIQRGLGAGTSTLPQTLLYEDVRAGTGYPRSPARWWRDTFGPDLASVEGILPAFDRSLPHRLMLRGFFLARYGRGGRCDDLLKLIEDFHDDLYEQYSSYTADRRPFAEDGTYIPEENWLGVPELGVLDNARQALARHVREVSGAAGDGAAEIALDRGVLAEIGSQLRAAADGFRPQGHLAQVAAGGGDPLLVLNQSFGGLSFPFSRFTHCFERAQTPIVDRLRANAAQIAPAGAVFAEITGGSATSNLNLHHQLTDHVIVCPGEHSSSPADEQLTLADLYLEHDPATDRLRLCSRRLGKEVVPVYLGYLLPMALPRIPRTLLLLSPAFLVRLDVWAGVPHQAGEGGITRRPRVRVGNVVVGRRSWSMRAGAAPLRTPGQTDADSFLTWQRWRADHHLPRTGFATVHQDRRGAPLTNPKPQYLDFDSFLSLQAFEALLERPDDRVVVRELLPSADDLLAKSSEGWHVTEFAIETYTRHGPPPYDEGSP